VRIHSVLTELECCGLHGLSLGICLSLTAQHAGSKTLFKG